MSVCAPPEVTPAGRVSLQAVLDRVAPAGSERRRANRVPFNYRLLLTPLDLPESAEDPHYVESQDFSAQGIGFEHQEQLPYRRVRLSAADPGLDEIGFGDLQIDLILKWCRFVSPGVYESGGRVTRTTVPLF